MRQRWFFLISCMLIGLLGCTQPKGSAPKGPEIDNEERPPLRILMIGSNDLSESMQTRWKSVSAQALSITLMSEPDFLGLDQCRYDVLLFPTRLLPDVVERGWVSPYLVKRSEAEEKYGWPQHWLRTVQYGKTYWGIPIGTTIPAVLQLEGAGQSEASQSTFDLTALATMPGNPTSPGTSSSLAGPVPTELTPEEQLALVDRFLIYHAGQQSISGNTSVFFQPLNMKPRLLEEKLSKSLETFAGMVQSNPSLRMSHEGAWAAMRSGKTPWTIGYPDSLELTPELPDAEVRSYRAFFSNATGVSDGNSLYGKSLVESGNGWIASRSRATRQSAVGNLFLQWLDQEEQRASFCSKTTQVVPRISGIASLSGSRADTSPYYRLVADGWNQQSVLQEFRIRGSNAYRAALANAILKIVKGDSLEDSLRKCYQDWESITEQLGRDSQRQSLERGLQLLDVTRG